MLEMGFQKSVESILLNVKNPGEDSRLAAENSLDDSYEFNDEYRPSGLSSSNSNKRNVQMLLFSATMPSWICSVTDKHMVNPVFLDAVQEGENRLASTIKHLSLRTPADISKIDSVKMYIQDLIFTKAAGTRITLNSIVV
jgi:superfamily II DNA/RNA helicase